MNNDNSELNNKSKDIQDADSSCKINTSSVTLVLIV